MRKGRSQINTILCW